MKESQAPKRHLVQLESQSPTQESVKGGLSEMRAEEGEGAGVGGGEG